MSFTAKIDADIKGFEDGVDKASQAINKLQSTVESKLTAIGTSFQNIGKEASILSAALVGVGTKAFLMAADFQDALGATEQIFKNSSGIIKDWSDNLSTSYGISKKEALDYANIMGTMLQNIGGMSEEMAGKTAGNLIELAGDLTAMFGGSTQDAVRALTGALKGNNTMLDNYGMAVNDALVKTRAFEMGLSDGTGELSLQAKQAATLSLIWEQTGAAQGQAAREADGASGSMRALKTEITNLSTEIGEVLLPIITPIVSGLKDIVSGFRALTPEMQKTIVIVGGAAAAFGPLMMAIGTVIKTLPLLSAGIAALAGPVGIVGAAIVALATLIITNWDYVKKSTKLVWDAVRQYINIALQSILGIGKVFVNIFQGNWKGAWESVRNTVVKVWDSIVQIIKNGVAWATNAVAGLFDFVGLDKLAAKMNSFASSLAPVIQPEPIPIEIFIPNESTTKINDITKSVENLNTSLEDTADKVERVNINMKDLKTISQPGEKGVQVSPIKISYDWESIEQFDRVMGYMKERTDQFNQYIRDAVENMAMAVG